MADSLGKKFEAVVKQDWKKSIPGSFSYRLPDSQAGYAGIGGSNPCDFFMFVADGIKENKHGKLFLVETKEHKGNTIGWDAIRQYDKLITYIGIKDVYPGVIVWFSDHDKVIWVSAEEMKKMHDDGKKSINIKMLSEGIYKIIEIPSVKKRVFLESDYSVLLKEEI